MELYQWYLVLGIFLVISEIYIPGFVVLPIGVAGIVTAAVAYFRPEVWIHAVFFICSSGLALLALARFRDSTQNEKNDTAAGFGLVGQTGTVTVLSPENQPLKVKIFGDVWDVLEHQAPPSGHQQWTVGAQVRVVAVHGNKISIQSL
ncbi:MAG: NfeD-like C-terminal, partner-binding [Pseudomonadota bacterium]|jgi:membrane protein implicated in regulation of membrane protease activity